MGSHGNATVYRSRTPQMVLPVPFPQHCPLPPELSLPTPSLAPPFRVWMAAIRVGVSWCLPMGFIRVSPIPGTQGSLPHTYWPFT